MEKSRFQAACPSAHLDVVSFIKNYTPPSNLQTQAMPGDSHPWCHKQETAVAGLFLTFSSPEQCCQRAVSHLMQYAATIRL